MGRPAAVFAGLAVSCLLTTAIGLGVTPVQQVIDMLNDMKAKGTTAAAVEQKTFASYKEWVDDQTTNLGFEITTLKSNIEKHIASIDKMESDIAQHSSKIADLDGEISWTESEHKSATAQREKERAEYQANQADHTESVYALERAIQTLKAKAFDQPQASALLQQMAHDSPKLRPAVAAFLMDTDGLDSSSATEGAPAVAAYEHQSGGVIDLLEKLLDKFRSELSDIERQESNRAHAYSMETQHLGATASRLKSEHDRKAALKGKTVSESGAAKGQLAAAKDDLAENEDLLAETKATFAMKERAFTANQQVRAEELAALEQAVAIIADPSVAGSYAGHIKLVQVRSHPSRALRGAKVMSFLQVSSDATSVRADAKVSAAEFLKVRSKELHSAVLSRAAMNTLANPFAKVVEMIENLLDKLKEEAASEADHKSFCDEELQRNKLKREETSAKVSMLEADVEKRSGVIQSQAAEISMLADEQAALAKAMGESTDARQKEKAQNEAAIKDAKEAQQALKKAIEILREFYSKQGGVELLQGRKQVPEMAAYKGMQSTNGGVIGMLEVIESDFLRLETETASSENQASKEYATFMSKSKAAAKRKHDREFQLTLSKDQEEFELGRTKEERGLAQTSKDEALNYYDTLKPQCIQVHVSFEERVARREEEIEALKQAYKILDEGTN
jgi:hypothetical protein